MSKQPQFTVDPREPQMDLDGRLAPGELLGEGGSCMVHDAMDRNLLRRTAMKVIRSELKHSRMVRQRIIEEAQITAQLEHPNILPVHELGVLADGSIYFTMQKAEGRTLSEIIAEQDLASRSESDLHRLLQIFLKVCDAVAFAHDHGVIHRDLKPDNIVVGDYGEVYLMDWGIARLKGQLRPTETALEHARLEADRKNRHSLDDELVGTLNYMAPEQARGRHLETDERSDIFSLGAVLYQIITREPPYTGQNLFDLLFQALGCKVRPPEQRVDVDIPSRLSQITMRALNEDPAARFQTVNELREELERFMQSGWLFQRLLFKPGERIVTEGEWGDCAFIITRGTCQVYKTIEGERRVLVELGPGNVFGETAVFAGQPRNASVEALTEVMVRVVTREHLEGDEGINQWMSLFVKELAQRFNERNNRAAELEREVEGLQAVHLVLVALLDRGREAPGGGREMPWSALCQALARQHGRTPEEIAALVQRSGTLVIDPVRDVVALQRRVTGPIKPA